MKTLAATVLFVVLALSLAACGDDVKADQPPKLTIGESTCSHCNMIISDERYASGATKDKADPQVYDDLGEMVMLVQQDELVDYYLWVHDFDTKEWLDAKKAFYVYSKDIMAPMGSNLAAFKDRAKADEFALTLTEPHVYDWATLLTDWTMAGGMH